MRRASHIPHEACAQATAPHVPHRSAQAAVCKAALTAAPPGHHSGEGFNRWSPLFLRAGGSLARCPFSIPGGALPTTACASVHGRVSSPPHRSLRARGGHLTPRSLRPDPRRARRQPVAQSLSQVSVLPAPRAQQQVQPLVPLQEARLAPRRLQQVLRAFHTAQQAQQLVDGAQGGGGPQCLAVPAAAPPRSANQGRLHGTVSRRVWLVSRDRNTCSRGLAGPQFQTARKLRRGRSEVR